MNTKGQLAGCVQPAPPPPPTPEAERQALDSRSPRLGTGAISNPETRILHQTASRLPVANHVFLRSWTADTCQEGRSLRSAPRRRHVAYPGNPAAGRGKVIKTHVPSGTARSPSTWLPGLLGPAKRTECTPSRVCALVEHPRTRAT